jgi:hypothetical protein
MSNRYLVLLLAVLAWAIAAIVLGSASLGLLDSGSGASSGAVSPACLPATLEHSARLAGTSVDVSPAPNTAMANPAGDVSFLGVTPAGIREVSVAGSRSGPHRGRLQAYSQGDGASFVPDARFEAGERVSVRAVIGSGAAAKRVAFGFRVDTPYPTAKIPEFHNPRAAPGDSQGFYTLPGVQAPILTVTVADRDPGAGAVLTTNGPGPGQYGPLIYAPDGRLIWFQRLPAGQTAENLSEQSYGARRVLTWWRGRVLELGFGQGEDIVTDSRYRTIARVTGANGLKADLHDFQLLPHDVAYITAYNPVRCDLRAAGGSAAGAIVDTAIQQIDMRTGLVRWEWHSLDHVGASESEVEAPHGATPWDYFHLNSIEPEPGGGLLLSARSTWAGYQLEAGSGRIRWRLGGNRSSFKMGPGTRMAWQHDGRRLASGELTFFDDGSNPPIHTESRGVQIRLDLGRHEARLTRVYRHTDPPLLAASQGNMQTLADGNTLLGYGGVPAISEFAPDGTLLFDAHQPFDMSFYRAFRFPWKARPQSPPAVLASLNNTSEETIVHASWNGATDVARWRVLAGSQAGSMSARATIPLSGFESAATLPRKYSYVQVQALDRASRVLGTSKAARVISYSDSLSGSGKA